MIERNPLGHLQDMGPDIDDELLESKEPEVEEALFEAEAEVSDEVSSLEEALEVETEEGALVEYDPLRAYLIEIQKYPLLSREEEQELAIRYKEKGDKEAAYRLITSNLRLVVKIAMEFHKSWMISLLDLIQEGNLGLVQAVRKFDPYRGVKLSSYASYWIKAYILKFILDNWRLIKIGTTQAQRKLFFNLRKEKERLDSMGFEPVPRLIAEKLDVREDEVIEMDQRMGSWEYSLDAPLEDGSRYTQKDFIASQEQSSESILAEAQLREQISQKLREIREKLNDKEKDILDNRLLSENPVTLQEIGARWGISRERVRQLEERLKKKIRVYLVEQIPGFEPGDLSLP